MKTLKTKVFLFALAIASFAMLLTACSKDEKAETAYKVELEKAEYPVPFEGEVNVRVIANRTASTDVTVNYSISGTIAEENYEVDAQSFVIKQGEKSAEIIVKVDTDKIQEGEELTITLTDSGPLVLFAGIKSTDILVLEDGALIYTFDKENYTMTETVVVSLTLSSPAGTYTAQTDLHIPIALSAASTAVEGTHFEFAGAKEIVIPAGKSKGTVELKLKEQEVGKDLVVLELAGGNPLLRPGNYDLANVVIFGSQYEQLVGSWTFKAFTNQEWWVVMSNYGVDDLSKLPTGAPTDKITFDEEGIKIAMTSDLKNYFREGAITYIKEELEGYQEVPGLNNKQTIVVVNALANVAFSNTTMDERLAEIGFRIIKEPGKVDILEVTIRDFEPVDFLQGTYNMVKGSGDVPAMRFHPLRYHFEKVSE